MNIIADYQPILNRALAITSKMQAWIDEAAELELQSSLMPPTAQQTKRLADIKGCLSICEDCFEDIQDLPGDPLITRALKAA